MQSDSLNGSACLPLQYAVFLFACLLTACGSAPDKKNGNEGRYAVEDDYHPVLLLNPDTISDAIPKDEPIRKAGNKSPYTVLGKTYTVMPSAKGYREEGGASWYGLKFHGHKTSNGEVYSIYAMTAAHKSLPIPSYVKVTNLENQKTAIVRVNDRGPFHPGRIIDLSYAAATKLDFIRSGTAKVLVEAIDPASFRQPARSMTGKQAHGAGHISSPSKTWLLQLAAYAQLQTAEQRLNRLQQSTDLPARVVQYEDQLHRLQIGPIYGTDIASARQLAAEQGFTDTILLPIN
ncbi:MAG: septal ring lytic transglycosylase RlpA family protein [Pseudomonadales bacterium]|nr:septal ring lytic transglycosylase RlpA family protein [Pseudomonadales bacterium]